MATPRAYWHTTLEQAIADANRWAGRCCVVPSDFGFEVIGGAADFALYVTVGMRYRDWERGYGFSPAPKQIA